MTASHIRSLLDRASFPSDAARSQMEGLQNGLGRYDIYISRSTHLHCLTTLYVQHTRLDIIKRTFFTKLPIG